MSWVEAADCAKTVTNGQAVESVTAYCGCSTVFFALIKSCPDDFYAHCTQDWLDLPEVLAGILVKKFVSWRQLRGVEKIKLV